jgi:hypothetical protein
MSVEEIYQKLNLDELKVPFILQPCCAVFGQGIEEGIALSYFG